MFLLSVKHSTSGERNCPPDPFPFEGRSPIEDGPPFIPKEGSNQMNESPPTSESYYTALAYLESGAHESEREGEQWRAIEGLAAAYSVSNYGRVRNDATGLMRKPSVHRQGYLRHSFYLNGRQVTRYVHRLVAAAFLPESPFPYVRHIDDNKMNNHASNLAWGRPIDNTRDAQRNGKIRPPFVDGLCRRGHPQQGNDISAASKNFNCRQCRREWELAYRRKRRSKP